MSSGSISSSTAPNTRLIMVTSHLSTRKHKVVVCRHLGPAMPLLESRTDIDVVLWPEDANCERGWLLENVKGATGLVVLLGDKVNEELLHAAGPDLKAVSTMSVGHDHIDLALMKKRGIRVGYTPDVLTEAVADLTVMLALMASRNDGGAYTAVENGLWPTPPYIWSPFKLLGPQLSTIASSPRRTVGFLGFGRIAQATLARLIGFGITHALYAASSASASVATQERDEALRQKLGLQVLERVDADRVARESDFVFILTPGGDGTYHIVDEAFLRKMKKLSVLVNTSRGTCVDSDALAKALREGWIWGAGLDVVEGEPNVTEHHPLAKEPRCVVIPHIGSATFETRLDMATTAVNNLLGALDGTEMPSELSLS
ncbi:hypothetical protein MKEN_00482600 [Mycena kentingensis (nom. inval.)]|nr:hypothetical protein MKEN_00482600 [Mycena kentingensis (nom. inval.)]